MGSCGLLWRLGTCLLVLGSQSVNGGGTIKNRSCISYGSNALTEGVEHLRGLILEDGHVNTIQCPHNQCCFGIWNLTQGQLQAKVQGEDLLWMEEQIFLLVGVCVREKDARKFKSQNFFRSRLVKCEMLEHVAGMMTRCCYLLWEREHCIP